MTPEAISDDAVRAFMAAEVPGILDEHLSLAIKSIDGDRVRAGLAAALPYLLEHLAAEGWRKLPDIKVGERVGYMWVPVLAGGGPKCIRGVVTAVYADGRVVADFEQPNLSAVAATMARIPPLTITAPADSFIRDLPVDDDLTVSSDTPPYLLEQERTEKEPVPTCGVCGRPVDLDDLAPPTVSMVEVPDRPGLVVRPVLSKPIRMDPETGAVCWCGEAP